MNYALRMENGLERRLNVPIDFVPRPWKMETRADDDEAPTDPAARKSVHHDYTEQDFEGNLIIIIYCLRMYVRWFRQYPWRTFFSWL